MDRAVLVPPSLDDNRNAVLTGLHGTLVSERSFELDGHSARDVTATIPGGTEFLRMIVVGQRVYSLVVVGQPSDAARAEAFFAAFEWRSKPR